MVRFLCQTYRVFPPGVNESLQLLADQYALRVDGAAVVEAEAHAMGWSVPAAAQIPMELAGLGYADWHLEPDELNF